MNTLLHRPVPVFIDILEKNGLIDGLYDALSSGDLAHAVITALNIINKPSIMAKLYKHGERIEKSDESSRKFREEGNNFFRLKDYRQARFYYNVALLFAPSNTEPMILALSNRSALFLEVGAIEACLKDIERCQTMQCSNKIIKKLEARKVSCSVLISKDVFETKEHMFAREYFKFDVKRNKDIPCASEDVDIVIENGVTKIIAAKDIDLGKIVSIEPSFVAILDGEVSCASCHYCHKLSLNLIPCDNCCRVFFCDEECQKQCFKEYHKIECQIINIIVSVSYTAKCRLSIVAALKIREMYDSWDDLISHSFKIGRMEDSSVSEIYDKNNKKSILNLKDDQHFVHGKIFNQSFVYAVILKYLSDIPGYMPHDVQKRTEAQAAMARIMLSIYLKFNSELDIPNSARNVCTREISTDPEPVIGLFAFASRLTHSCMPNLLSVGLGHKLALIAVKHIQKGTELTIAYRGHWCETTLEEGKATRLFCAAELRCQCRVCIEGWTGVPSNTNPVPLTYEQSKCFRDFFNSEFSYLALFNIITREQFRDTCRVLEVFQDLGNTPEYVHIFKIFRSILTLFQYLYNRNTVL